MDKKRPKGSSLSAIDVSAKSAASATRDPFDDDAREAELERIFGPCRRLLAAFEEMKPGVSQSVLGELFSTTTEQSNQIFGSSRRALAVLLASRKGKTGPSAVREYKSQVMDKTVRQILLFDMRANGVRCDQFHAGENLACENPYSARRFKRISEHLFRTFGAAVEDRTRELEQEYFERQASFESFRATIAERAERRRRKEIAEAFSVSGSKPASVHAAATGSNAAAENDSDDRTKDKVNGDDSGTGKAISPSEGAIPKARRAGPGKAPLDGVEAWPPDDGLHFRDSLYAYRGEIYNLGGRLWTLLKLLAESRFPLTARQMSSDGGDIASVRTDLTNLRKVLRKNHSLPKQSDPIPRAQKAPPTTWKLDIESALNSTKSLRRRISGK